MDKQENEMLQIEFYISDLDRTCSTFEEVFDFFLIEKKPGWRHLRHPNHFDFMLFSPGPEPSEENNWSLPKPGTGGKGIEIVICTINMEEKREKLLHQGYRCSPLKYPPWGDIEFLFYLEEGYLIRVKQPFSSIA